MHINKRPTEPDSQMCWRTREGRKAQGLDKLLSRVERRGSGNRDDQASTLIQKYQCWETEEEQAGDTREEPQLLQTPS